MKRSDIRETMVRIFSVVPAFRWRSMRATSWISRRRALPAPAFLA